MTITGDVLSEGEVQIDGSVNGDIRCNDLLIGETADVRGEIFAEKIRVHGRIDGQIKARSVTLAKTAHMLGDILHENLAIEEGAFLEGHCKRMEFKESPVLDGKPKPAAEPAPGTKKSPANETSKKAAS